jgi:hypothetical protein
VHLFVSSGSGAGVGGSERAHDVGGAQGAAVGHAGCGARGRDRARGAGRVERAGRSPRDLVGCVGWCTVGVRNNFPLR